LELYPDCERCSGLKLSPDFFSGSGGGGGYTTSGWIHLKLVTDLDAAGRLMGHSEETGLSDSFAGYCSDIFDESAPEHKPGIVPGTELFGVCARCWSRDGTINQLKTLHGHSTLVNGNDVCLGQFTNYFHGSHFRCWGNYIHTLKSKRTHSADAWRALANDEPHSESLK